MKVIENITIRYRACISCHFWDI